MKHKKSLLISYADQCEGFVNEIHRFRHRNDYTPFNMSNMDEIMCRLDMAANTAMSEVKEIYVWPHLGVPKEKTAGDRQGHCPYNATHAHEVPLLVIS